jgi:hypothetical protein
VGVLFFRKWNLKPVELSQEEKGLKAKELGLNSRWNLPRKFEYKIVPIGLPIWLAFLLIIWYFIPIVNLGSFIVYTFVIIMRMDLYSISFEKVFGPPSKLLKFLNKKI